jgi:MFS family permease
MFLTLIGMQVERQVAATGSTVNQFAEGIRFIFNHRTFVVLIPLTWVWMFFGFSFNQLMPAFADSLGTHEIGFGALMSAVGLGSAVGTVLVSSIQQHRHLGFTMLAGLLFGGVALVGFGIAVVYGTTSFAFEAALVFAFLVGVFGSVYLITSMTVLQIQVPDALRGRVMGIHIISFYLMPLGGLFMGVIASTYDDSLAVIVGAFVVLVITVVAMISQRDIRRIDGRELSDSGPDSHQLTDSTRA